MKTASTFLQFLALSACLAAQFCEPGEFRMPGMRRALQTMEGTPTLPSMGRVGASAPGWGDLPSENSLLLFHRGEYGIEDRFQFEPDLMGPEAEFPIAVHRKPGSPFFVMTLLTL
jgi:hypothetical protein